MLLSIVVAAVSTSCVSLVTPQQAPIQPDGKAASPVGIAVVDHRKNVLGGGRMKQRYMGRCRLGLYGIPTHIMDPKESLGDRVTEHLQAGFAIRGVEVRTLPADGTTDSAGIARSLAGTGARRILILRLLDDTWIDFANPMMGKESILYFNASAAVHSADVKVLATGSRKIERNFRYDVNDSLFNQAVWTLQPEFTALINQPAIRKALAS